MSRKVSPVIPVQKKSVSIDPNQQAFNLPQGAVYSGLSHWQMRMAIWEGKLPARKVGKSYLILRSDLDAFLKSLPAVSPNGADWLQRRKASSTGRAA